MLWLSSIPIMLHWSLNVNRPLSEADWMSRNYLSSFVPGVVLLIQPLLQRHSHRNSMNLTEAVDVVLQYISKSVVYLAWLLASVVFPAVDFSTTVLRRVRIGLGIRQWRVWPYLRNRLWQTIFYFSMRSMSTMRTNHVLWAHNRNFRPRPCQIER